MKSNNFLSCDLLPISIICLAINGEVDAMNEILNRYTSYINKLSLRVVYDTNGVPHKTVDEYMRRRLETKLILAVTKFSLL